MPNKPNRTRRSTTDTRGLPFDMDPRKFYEYSALEEARTAKGLEGLLFQLMPFNFIKSFAFAIDPLSNYKTSTGRVSPRVRQRWRNLQSVLHASSNVFGDKTVESWGTIPNYGGLGINSPFMKLVSTTRTPMTRTNSVQPLIFDWSKDTTRRLRVIGSDIGEFEYFKSQLFSSPRSFYIFNRIYATQIMSPNPQKSDIRTHIARHVGPSAATLGSSVANSLKAHATITASQLIDDNILSMLHSVSPAKRDFGLFRSIVELKDYPRSVVSLQQTALDLFKLGKSLNVEKVSRLVHNLRVSSKHIPDEYLSYSFGWRQLYNDVMNVLVAPDKIAKRINFLIRRNGKDTTHRLERHIALPNYPMSSGFTYSAGNFAEEQNLKTSHRCEESAILRLVVNSNFEFPPADLPNFKNRKFLDLLGVSPTPMDLYNLTPWTWLFDWFTGFGNYLQIIEDINSDPSLVNWGLITSIVRGELITDMQSEIISTRSEKINGVGPYLTIRDKHTHQSRYSYEYRIRKDVSSVNPSVRKFWDIGSLTLYQQSILGSLVSQRLRFQR